MKEGLLEKIQADTHWRVNIRPAVPVAEKLSLQRCAQVVEKASVSLRGWDYPHVSTRTDDHGGSGLYGEFVANWCDWNRHTEFWRMYKSSQFLHYLSLRENMREDDRMPEGKVLNVTGTVYSLTEMAEFLFRLARGGLYEHGAKIHISLERASGRRLWVSEFNRMSFFNKKETQAETINLSRDLTSSDLAGASNSVSLPLILELFDHFGWTANRDQIAQDQANFFRKQF
ncbi:MAG: hypothetical protein K2Z25_21610 [Beijerinckiaceae bacterium]|nr:hypothetical protein [Beijerinckiaceae bacterium]